LLKPTGVKKEDVIKFWDRMDRNNSVFQYYAKEICNECYEKSDKLLAIDLLKNTCKQPIEAEKYADKLKEAGVAVCFHEPKGTIHGFEIRKKSKYTRSIIEKRIEHLKKNLYNQ